MTSKGTHSGKCCCGECAEVPLDTDELWRTFDRLQQYCCACVPKKVCVTFVSDYDGSTDTVVLELQQPCVDGSTEEYHPMYSGTINTSVQSVDIEFSFRPDEYAETCHFCLKSEALGIEYDCLEVTGAVRNEICFSCGRLCCEDEGGDGLPDPYQEACENLEWNVPISDAAPGGGTIYLCPADYVRIPPCGKCVPHCVGCGCICGVACITVIEGGIITLSEAVPLDVCDWTYTTTNGIVIEIAPGDYDDCCYLDLKDLGESGLVFDELPSPVKISGSCPDPTAEWMFISGQDDVQIEFECAVCDECITPCPCPKLEFRETMLEICFVATGDITGTGTLYNSGAPDVCGFEGFDSDFDLETYLCDELIRLQLTSGGDGDADSYRLSGELLGLCSDFEDIAPRLGSTCEPLSLVFDVSVPCEFGTCDFTITINEC